MSISASFASALALFTNLVSEKVENESVVILGFQLLWNGLVYMMLAMHSIYGLLLFNLFLLVILQTAKFWILIRSEKTEKNEDSIEELKKTRILIWLATTILLHKVNSKAFAIVTSISIFVTFMAFLIMCLNFYQIVDFFDPVVIDPDKFLVFVIAGPFFILVCCISFFVKICRIK